MSKKIPEDWGRVKVKGNQELDLSNILDTALQKTLKEDFDILKRRRSERLFGHRFACNLETTISNLLSTDTKLRVDAPYNKYINGAKQLRKKDGSDQSIEVDIVLHQRGTNKQNLLVIEIETTNNPEKDDLWKLEGMTKTSGEYEYEYGLYLCFGIENKAGKILNEIWYKNGKEADYNLLSQ